MFDSSVKRLGYACITLHHDQSLSKAQLERLQRPFAQRTCTATAMRKLSDEAQLLKLTEVVTHNLEALSRAIERFQYQPSELRMFRIGSGVLPLRTHPEFRAHYQAGGALDALITQSLSATGARARELDVRLSMHPGQFVVLASDRDDVVQRSIEELEYHGDIVRGLGYGREFQDFKLNVHCSGRRGATGLREVLPELSVEVRRTLTIENDEVSHGLDETLQLADAVALVLDVHHHWVKTGERIKPCDARWSQIRESWRGVRPAIHYSAPSTLGAGPVLPLREAVSGNFRELRKHSQMFPNQSLNRWALEFNDQADIMCEAKLKNLAQIQLFVESLEM